MILIKSIMNCVD